MRRAMAQQSTTSRRLALVNASLKIADMRIGGDSGTHILLQELEQLGFVEGRNLTIDRYSAEGRVDRYADLARQVVATHPDVISVGGSPLTLRLKAATTTILSSP